MSKVAVIVLVVFGSGINEIAMLMLMIRKEKQVGNGRKAG